MLNTQLSFGQNPNWNVNSASFALDASVVGEIKLDNKIITNTNTLVAAFDDNNNIRGVTNLNYFASLDKYVFFLTIYGNKGGEILNFRVYDPDLNIVVSVPSTTLEFIPNKITGDIVNPFLVEAQTNVLPSVKTFNASNITNTSTHLKGGILNNGKATITEKGFVYSTEDSYPKLDELNVSKVVNNGNSIEFTNTISNLDTGKNIYFYRAFATNSFGTSYGDVKRFSLNNGLNFDQIDDKVSVNDNNKFDFSNGLSVDLMLYPTSFTSESTIISQASAFVLSIKSGGTIEAKIATDVSNFMTFTTNLRVELNKWQHLAFTYQNNGTIKIYIKGVKEVNGRTSNKQTGSVFDSSHPIIIGANENSNFFKGTLDELRIWKSTLSESTVKAIQRKVIPTRMKGLVAYYNCNQGVKNGNNAGILQLLDKTSSNVHGSLDGFTKNGATSNFTDGVSGNFENESVAQNTFMSSGNWSNPNNWSFGIVPSKIDRVVIEENQTITIDTNELEVDDLVLGTNSTIRIPKDNAIIVNNSFESNGVLELDSDTNNSGVLMVNGNTTGEVIYKRGVLLANKWSIVTPPVSGQKIKEFAQNSENDIRVNTNPNPNRYAIAYYDDSKPAGQRWVYYTEDINENEEFTAGQSYSMSRATDGSVTFKGKLNVDNLKKTLVGGQWNAIGNPFTTYYPANKNNGNSFLTDNFDLLDDTFKSLYIWDNIQNKYVAVSNVSETAKSLPPGQGFFVKLKNEDAEINFQKDKRTFKPSSGDTDFEKNSEEITIKIIAKKEKTEVSTSIKFFEHTSTGFDSGYDIGNFDGSTLDIYSKLVVDDYTETTTKNFTIQSLSRNNFDGLVIPLGLIAKQGDAISISGVFTNLPNELKVYLEDRDQNTFTVIEEGKSFDWVAEKEGATEDRFYLNLSSQALNTSINTLTGISMYGNNKSLFIRGLQEEGYVLLYSTIGTTVFQNKVYTGKAVDLQHIATGIYIAELRTSRGKITKKIILQ